MHIARHDKKNSLCLFFTVKIRAKGRPIAIMNVTMAFETSAEKKPQGLRISDMHQWPAKTPDGARAVLIKTSNGPASTRFEPFAPCAALS
jgi:hypothetical protein